jgi:hypothetical protein
MIFVLAGNYQQYERWRRDNQIGPTASIYVLDAETLNGQTITKEDCVIEVGTFYQRKDAAEIRDRVRVIKIRGGHER